MVYGIWYTVRYLRESKLGGDKMSEKRKSVETGDQVECPHCHELANLSVTKSGRFTFLCHNCGLQCFSRGDKSEKWFGELVKKARERLAQRKKK